MYTRTVRAELARKRACSLAEMRAAHEAELADHEARRQAWLEAQNVTALPSMPQAHNAAVLHTGAPVATSASNQAGKPLDGSIQEQPQSTSGPSHSSVAPGPESQRLAAQSSIKVPTTPSALQNSATAPVPEGAHRAQSVEAARVTGSSTADAHEVAIALHAAACARMRAAYDMEVQAALEHNERCALRGLL